MSDISTFSTYTFWWLLEKGTLISYLTSLSFFSIISIVLLFEGANRLYVVSNNAEKFKFVKWQVYLRIAFTEKHECVLTVKIASLLKEDLGL